MVAIRFENGVLTDLLQDIDILLYGGASFRCFLISDIKVVGGEEGELSHVSSFFSYLIGLIFFQFLRCEYSEHFL